MIAWILKNREWLFSGLGVAVCTILVALIRRVVGDQQARITKPTNQSISVNQAPSVTQSPSIHIHTAHQAESIDRSHRRANEQGFVEESKLFALSPWTGEKAAQAIFGLIVDDEDNATVCVARFKTTNHFARAAPFELEASLEYKCAIRVAGKLVSRRVAHVNQARWVGAGTMKEVSENETVELILAVRLGDGLIALEGPVAKSKDDTAEITPIKCPGELSIHVTLQDLSTGDRWTLSYTLNQRHMIAIEQSPLFKTT